MDEMVVIPPASPPDDMATAEGRTETTNPAKLYIINLPAVRSRENMAYVLCRVARDVFQVEGLENAPWRELRAKHIDFMAALLRQEGCKTNTVNVYIAAMKGVAKQAFKLGLIDAGIWTRIGMVQGKKPNDEREGRALSEDEVNRLLRACLDDDNLYLGLRDAAMFALMTWAGLRIVDTQRLRIQDILDDGKKILVHGKGGRLDKLPINPAVKKHIDRWLGLRARLGQIRPDWPLICRVRKGGDIRGDISISKTSYSKILKKRVEEAVIGSANPHDLRRTLATWLEGNGVSLNSIKVLMRHEKIETTAKYLMDSARRAEVAINAVDFEGVENGDPD